MDLDLQGKSAIVTGGSTGIGAAIALGLAREGCDVAINYQGDDDEAHGVAREIEALGRRAQAYDVDVKEHADAAKMVDAVVERFGRLDILISNAGINRDGVIWKMTEEQWDAVIDVNLKGCFNYNQAAARVFKNQNSGKIVNVSSINGMRGRFGQTNYAASKGGEIALTKALARELGRYNVNVNSVAPGLVMTAMTRKMPPEALESSLNETAFGRAASVEEIADVVVFLCSDRARHITGEVIKVDGGQYM
jgi:3-oxoacyl-[acyl-carrier protein] reductase